MVARYPQLDTNTHKDWGRDKQTNATYFILGLM